MSVEARNDCLHPEDWLDPDYEDWLDEVRLTDDWESNDYPEASYAVCPRCKGTGLDRWEEDDCTTCLGEGQVLNDLPIVFPIR